MKLLKIALSTSTVLATFIATTTHSYAASLVNQALDILNTPPSGEPTFTFSQQGITSLGSSDTFTTAATTAPIINNNINDLKVPVNNIVYQILSPNIEFGTVTSNAFKVALSPDKKTATFSGASLLPGQDFRINRTVSDGSAVQFRVSFPQTTTVPEPSSILGVLVVGALGGALKKKLAVKKA